jgi:hypothetical protein
MASLVDMTTVGLRFLCTLNVGLWVVTILMVYDGRFNINPFGVPTYLLLDEYTKFYFAFF